MILYAVVSLDPDMAAMTIHHVKPFPEARRLLRQGRFLAWVPMAGPVGLLDLNKSVRIENVEWGIPE